MCLWSIHWRSSPRFGPVGAQDTLKMQCVDFLKRAQNLIVDCLVANIHRIALIQILFMWRRDVPVSVLGVRQHLAHFDHFIVTHAPPVLGSVGMNDDGMTKIDEDGLRLV
ncbi:hypothetical protein MVEN_00620200 [Mycena venus]|uniref:Uncharacterized protein n=1 Tax=Mycena venus TaxID=2733690 RepID=A0A8H7D569_9AGAR|nr:hypothetical protein MVEN_00620200 [Mycena venus]